MLGRSRKLVVVVVAGPLAAASISIGVLTSVSSSAGSDIDRTVRVLAVADAVVSSGAPRASQGSGARLVAANIKGVQQLSYIKLTVRPAALEKGSVVGAKLLLTPRSAVTSSVQVHTVTNTAWSASTLTFRNRPAPGAVVGDVARGAISTRWVDVSSVVKGPGVYAFALTAATGSADFASSETNRGPELVLRLKDGASATPTRKPSPTESPTAQPSPTSTPTKTSAPRPNPGQCNETFPGEPCAGEMYYGASVEGGDPRTLEARAGAGLTLFRSYMQPSTPAARFESRAVADIAAGRIPLISTKVPGTWASVAAGNHDAWLTERIKVLAGVKGPVWLVLHHEPRGDGNAADWVRMQQHARDLIDRYSTNIALVGILNGWDFLERNGNPQAYRHPVGTGVDILGFDSYNRYTPKNGMEWKGVEEAMSPGLTIQSWGYPTLVGETGVHAVAGDGGRGAGWIRDQFAYGVSHDFVGISYFDSTANSTDGGWVLTGDRLAAFAKNLSLGSVARP